MVDTVGEMALRSAVAEDAVAASVFSVSLAEKPIRLTVFLSLFPFPEDGCPLLRLLRLRVFFICCVKWLPCVVVRRQAQAVTLVVRRDNRCEVAHRNDAQAASDAVDEGEGEVFGDEAGCEDAGANANVPRGEVGACGSGALVVRCKVDVERVVGREHCTEA